MTTGRVRVVLAVALAVVCGPMSTAGQAQTPAAARTAVEKAWRAGQFDAVEALAQAAPSDPAVQILRARAAAATGDYAKAESILRPLSAANPIGEASLETGLLLRTMGRRVESRRALQQVFAGDTGSASARQVLLVARAARALGRFEDANALFRDAAAMAPTDPVINAEWGELFLEKYNNRDAARSFEDALKTDPDYGPALLGMARAVADENPPAAIGFAQRALKQNPSSIAAHLFLAGQAIDRDKKAEARRSIDKALAINPRSLEALSLVAALAYVDGRDREYQEAVASALKIHPNYGEAYRVVGSVTARAYRFEEAAAQVRKAIALDRELTRAYADLGAHLMRAGDERGARRALETAFRADPYDVITFNLLALLDTLEPFDTIRDGILEIRLHPDEAAVMRHYAPALAREALDALSTRWAFTPTGPLLVQLFPRHDDFAVRTLGLPGLLGALGACFGKVVTLDSPRARPPGSFNWGVTLWHEMAHVITLQLSNQRVPRWLTEGISTFEEKRARDEWGREMDIPFAQAIEHGQVLKLRDLNAGFTNPETISLAYFQSSLVVEHIVELYGQPKLRALVQSYATGIDTEQAIRQVLAVEWDGLQATFDAFVERRYGALRRALAVPEGLAPNLPAEKLKALVAANPGSYPAHMALGEALAESSPDAALASFERAAALVPNAIGDDSPNARIAELALARGDKARAVRALETLTSLDPAALASARTLATLVDPVKEPARLRVALERAVAVDPFDAPSHATLGRLALAAGRTPDAVRMFRVALAAGAVDKAGAHADLAEALALAGQPDEAKRQALAALEVAPTYTRAQDLLLKLTQGSD